MTSIVDTTGLALAGVSLEYGDGDSRITALDDITLMVEPGEVVAVVGPSGSGKSSLLAVAGALIRPSYGSVHVGGTDVVAATGRARAALRRTRLGYVFQSGNLVPSLTVRDQLLLIRHLNGRATVADRGYADELLEAVGLEGKAQHRPHQLSGGELQRAGVARALMNRPSVLLADEPTAALDQHRARDIVNLLATQARARNTATVLVTHDVGLLDVADRVVQLRDGRLE